METIVLKGIITDDGNLQVEIPPDLPPGPVEVEIRRQEIRGITLGEILKSDLIGMWADREDITDSVEFARELRRRASRRGVK
ncbi:MAG: hypothetical protein HZC41_26570 [Chloroflexi bacterium]|nr:hypothetical protein [Chloroflexota bacterium]